MSLAESPDMKLRFVAPLSFVLLFSLSSCLAAQEVDSQLWTQYLITGKWKNGLRILAEVQPRFGKNYGRTSRFLLRGAVGYQVSPEFSVWVGHAWTPTFTPEFNSEDRWYHLLLWESHFPGFDLINRLRLEERSISGAGGTSFRGTYRLRVEKPLDKKKRLSGILYDEFLWNLNSTPRGAVMGFDQNRTFFGLGYKLTGHTKMEAGYLVNFTDVPSPRRDQRADILFLSLNYNL